MCCAPTAVSTCTSTTAHSHGEDHSHLVQWLRKVGTKGLAVEQRFRHEAAGEVEPPRCVGDLEARVGVDRVGAVAGRRGDEQPCAPDDHQGRE